MKKIHITASNTEILPKRTVSADFRGKLAQNSAETARNILTRKLGEISVFYAVTLIFREQSRKLIN